MIPAFLEKARDAARKSTFRKYKVGCVLATGTYIQAIGKNSEKPPKRYRADYAGRYSTHAELDALLKSRGDLRGATCYVWVENDNGNPVVSRPCEICFNLLKTHGIKWIVWSNRGDPVVEKV